MYRKISKNYPPICESVDVWAKTQPQDICRVVCASISKSKTIQRKYPITIEAKNYPHIKRHLSGESPKNYLLEMQRAKIIGLNGLIILPNGQYATEVVLNESNLINLPE